MACATCRVSLKRLQQVAGGRSQVSSARQSIIGTQHDIACVLLKRLQQWHMRVRRAAGDAIICRQLQLVHNVLHRWLMSSFP